jgi:integrase/recombinase XerD
VVKERWEDVKVQRIKVENKPYPLYLLLDEEYQVIEPVMRFINI